MGTAGSRPAWLAWVLTNGEGRSVIIRMTGPRDSSTSSSEAKCTNVSRGTRRRILGLAGTTSFRKPPISCLVLQVAFLKDTPSAEAVSRLPQRSPSDAFAVRGRNVHLHYPTALPAAS